MAKMNAVSLFYLLATSFPHFGGASTPVFNLDVVSFLIAVCEFDAGLFRNLLHGSFDERDLIITYEKAHERY